MSTSHVIFQSWEIIIEPRGIERILGIKPLVALGLSALINIVFILGARAKSSKDTQKLQEIF
jgi:hypothetical protein